MRSIGDNLVLLYLGINLPPGLGRDAISAVTASWRDDVDGSRTKFRCLPPKVCNKMNFRSPSQKVGEILGQWIISMRTKTRMESPLLS